MSQIEILNLFVTSAMFGIIWLVQVVHYPILGGLEVTSFKSWHQFHSRRISYVVGPLMIAEIAFALILVWQEQTLLRIAAMAATVLIWASTFLVSVPLHEKLERHSDGATELKPLLIKLVRTNWVRTFLYTLKIILLIGVFGAT